MAEVGHHGSLVVGMAFKFKTESISSLGNSLELTLSITLPSRVAQSDYFLNQLC